MTDDKCFLSLGIMYNRDYCDIIFIQKDYLGVHTHFKHEEITFILDSTDEDNVRKHKQYL